jgi:hypothetical protein
MGMDNIKAVITTRRITVCLLCNRGVYIGQKYEWARNPMGINHTECLNLKQKDNNDGHQIS